jgi:hypothetical protein
MRIVQIRMGIEREVDKAMDRFRPIPDMMRRRPCINGAGFILGHDQGNRLIMPGAVIIIELGSHGIVSSKGIPAKNSAALARAMPKKAMAEL